MIAVRVKHLPIDSALAMATGSTGWTLPDYLLADLFYATAGHPHPGLPDPDKANPERAKARRRAKVRARKRQRAIDAGEIT